ncbi:hypothetical protein Nepgr_031713 [Nepenthes gracilis]|uniref:Uncharacterized protein n=1 Tax=Nepenthes gracilis TaxID=150966 RepID=A0AAD3TH92_NEPGR|nr:hypothetical protein Nepgr_031713 [Nepenthes gracilis]
MSGRTQGCIIKSKGYEPDQHKCLVLCHRTEQESFLCVHHSLPPLSPVGLQSSPPSSLGLSKSSSPVPTFCVLKEYLCKIEVNLCRIHVHE